MILSRPRSTFTWVTQTPDADAVAALQSLAAAVCVADLSLATDRRRTLDEFTTAKQRAGRQTIVALIVYIALVAVSRRALVALGDHLAPQFMSIIPIILLIVTFMLVGRPFYKWITFRDRIRSLTLAKNEAEFLFWLERRDPPFVLYLRDFASWERPHFYEGAFMTADPLVRELGWAIPRDVNLVVVYNVKEITTKARNVVHLLSTEPTWEPLIRSACAFAAMIVIAPRRSGRGLERELEIIRQSPTLQRKTLLLYEDAQDQAVQSLLRLVRWSAALWRPWGGQPISGLDKLPSGMELVAWAKDELFAKR